MSNSRNPRAIAEQQFSSQDVQALEALAIGSSSKSQLATQVFGSDGPSERTRMTRISARLVNAGLARESRQGRERLLEITDSGKAHLGAGRVAKQAEPVWPTFTRVLEDVDRSLAPKLSADLSEREAQFSEDRPRFHLRHAALLSLYKLLKKPNRSLADDRYEQMLLTLAYEQPDNASADQRIYLSLERGWVDRGIHKRLARGLVCFEDVLRRRNAGSDIVALGERVETGEDAILWSSAAIDLAHHYSFTPASPLDRLTARRLLRKARELLLELAYPDPLLRVAARYRLEKAAKVSGMGWTAMVDQLHEDGVQEEEEDPELRELLRVIRMIDRHVVRASSFNQCLERLDRSLSAHLSRWIMSAMPSSEWVFRAAGGPGLAGEIRDWGKEMGEAGVLRDLVLPQVEACPSLQGELKGFISSVAPFQEGSFSAVVRPHVQQANALLGKEVRNPEGQPPYDWMLLNNLWTPEMVAAHCIVEHQPQAQA